MTSSSSSSASSPSVRPSRSSAPDSGVYQQQQDNRNNNNSTPSAVATSGNSNNHHQITAPSDKSATVPVSRRAVPASSGTAMNGKTPISKTTSVGNSSSNNRDSHIVSVSASPTLTRKSTSSSNTDINNKTPVNGGAIKKTSTTEINNKTQRAEIKNTPTNEITVISNGESRRISKTVIANDNTPVSVASSNNASKSVTGFGHHNSTDSTEPILVRSNTNDSAVLSVTASPAASVSVISSSSFEDNNKATPARVSDGDVKGVVKTPKSTESSTIVTSTPIPATLPTSVPAHSHQEQTPPLPIKKKNSFHNGSNATRSNGGTKKLSKDSSNSVREKNNNNAVLSVTSSFSSSPRTNTSNGPAVLDVTPNSVSKKTPNDASEKAILSTPKNSRTSETKISNDSEVTVKNTPNSSSRVTKTTNTTPSISRTSSTSITVEKSPLKRQQQKEVSSATSSPLTISNSNNSDETPKTPKQPLKENLQQLQEQQSHHKVKKDCSTPQLQEKKNNNKDIKPTSTAAVISIEKNLHSSSPPLGDRKISIEKQHGNPCTDPVHIYDNKKALSHDRTSKNIPASSPANFTFQVSSSPKQVTAGALSKQNSTPGNEKTKIHSAPLTNSATTGNSSFVITTDTQQQTRAFSSATGDELSQSWPIQTPTTTSSSTSSVSKDNTFSRQVIITRQPPVSFFSRCIVAGSVVKLALNTLRRTIYVDHTTLVQITKT